MLISSCICSGRKKNLFKKIIEYKNEKVFTRFEGTVIGRCSNCGILKTFPKKNKGDFDSEQSRADYYEKSREKFSLLFQPLVGLIKKYFITGKILDVGCSSGLLLFILRQNGFKIKGIEPNIKAYEIARAKLENGIFLGTLRDFVLINREKFDCVIYNHVLEHIADPVEEINLAKKILKKNGLLIIGVPNTDNLIFYLRKKYWEPLMPNEHIWHFNSNYLINLLRKLKLDVKEKFYFNDGRSDYPLFKRIYFRTLSLINKLFNTGEAVLLLVKLK